MGKGDSGGSQQIETPKEPEVDYTPMYEAMGQMMAMSAQTNAQTTEAMTAMQANAPAATATAEQDWKKRSEELREKMSANMTSDAAAKRGRESTILTSPLTEEKVKTTESVLTGK